MKQRYENYEIESIDDSNYTVSRATTVMTGQKAGQERLTTISYHSRLYDAVRRVAQLCGNVKPDLKSWLVEYRKVHSDFEGMLP